MHHWDVTDPIVTSQSRIVTSQSCHYGITVPHSDVTDSIVTSQSPIVTSQSRIVTSQSTIVTSQSRIVMSLSPWGFHRALL